jgi:hypothetical protein
MTPDIIEQVALVTGHIIHAGTGESIFGRVRITVREGRVVDKMLIDGTFVVSGRPEVLFPRLASQAYQLTLDIRADSPQYRQGFIEQSRTVAIPAGTSFDPPIPLGTISLPADLVNIRGSVVEAQDPTTPIAAATVEVQSSAGTRTITTGATGRYRLNDIIVTAPAQIRCSASGFTTQTRPLLVDFGRIINEEYFRLAP